MTHAARLSRRRRGSSETQRCNNSYQAKDAPPHVPTFESLEPRVLFSGTDLSALFDTAVPIQVAAAGLSTMNDYVVGAATGNMYKFTAPAKGTFCIDMVAGGDLDPYLQLYDSRGRRMAANNNASRHTSDSRIRRRVNAGQTYYVLASSVNGASGGYSISLASNPTDDIGNAPAAAKTRRLRRDGAGAVNGTVNYASDNDYIRVVATQTGLMRMSMSAAGRGNTLSCSLEAYDGSGALLTSAAAQEMSFDVVAGQAYYLKAAGASGTTGRYRLNIRPTLPAAIAYANQADPPASGSVVVTGSVGQGGENGYVFVADARGRFQVAMNATAGDINPVLNIYNANGKVVRRNDNYGGSLNSYVRFSVRDGQTYYIGASAAPGTSGAYELVLTSDPVDDAGNTLAAAKTMRLNRRGQARAGGNIQYADDVDVLAMVAAKTGSANVSMTGRGRGASLNCELAAYDADGVLLARAGGGQQRSISFDVTAGGRYYIAAASADAGTGRYRITVVNTEAPPSPAGLPAIPPAAGASVRAQVLAVAGGSQLIVAGTDDADTITISRSGNSLTLAANGANRRFSGTFAGIVVYGFGGADTVTVAHSLSASTWILAGDGDDSIYAAGTGADTLWGGEGDDLLVAVGGGADALWGDGGLDSYWFDSTDTMSDASPAETAAGSVHRITEFYQPHTNNRSSPNYVSLEIASQNYLDPSITAYASRYADFSHVPLFVDGPQYDDIDQGAVGDCYYLAVLSSLADSDPDIIEQAITSLGDGTYAVRFYRNGGEVYLRLDADLPVTYWGSLAYARLGDDGELWGPLMEKAYAYFRYGSNSYASISGGWMMGPYRQITNRSTSIRWASGSSTGLYNYISDSLSAGHAVTAGSYYSASAPIVGSHAYVFKSVETNESGRYVTVYNPWGVDGRLWDSNYRDGLLTISIDRVISSFSLVVTSLA